MLSGLNDEVQSTFVKDRLIADNALLAMEVFHYVCGFRVYGADGFPS